MTHIYMSTYKHNDIIRLHLVITQAVMHGKFMLEDVFECEDNEVSSKCVLFDISQPCNGRSKTLYQ